MPWEIWVGAVRCSVAPFWRSMVQGVWQLVPFCLDGLPYRRTLNHYPAQNAVIRNHAESVVDGVLVDRDGLRSANAIRPTLECVLPAVRAGLGCRGGHLMRGVKRPDEVVGWPVLPPVNIQQQPGGIGNQRDLRARIEVSQSACPDSRCCCRFCRLRSRPFRC